MMIEDGLTPPAEVYSSVISLFSRLDFGSEVEIGSGRVLFSEDKGKTNCLVELCLSIMQEARFFHD